MSLVLFKPEGTYHLAKSQNERKGIAVSNAVSPVTARQAGDLCRLFEERGFSREIVQELCIDGIIEHTRTLRERLARSSKAAYHGLLWESIYAKVGIDTQIGGKLGVPFDDNYLISRIALSQIPIYQRSPLSKATDWERFISSFSFRLTSEALKVLEQTASPSDYGDGGWNWVDNTKPLEGQDMSLETFLLGRTGSQIGQHWVYGLLKPMSLHTYLLYCEYSVLVHGELPDKKEAPTYIFHINPRGRFVYLAWEDNQSPDLRFALRLVAHDEDIIGPPQRGYCRGWGRHVVSY